MTSFVTYDKRLAEAASAAGLVVDMPSGELQGAQILARGTADIGRYAAIADRIKHRLTAARPTRP